MNNDSSNNIHDLFRQDALALRRNRVQGELSISSEKGFKKISVIMCVTAIATSGWFLSSHYNRVETVRGIVETDSPTTKILANRPGILEKLFVKEGQSVVKGQTLAIVQIEQDYEQGKSTVKQSLESFKSQSYIATNIVKSLKDRLRSEKISLKDSLVNNASQQESLKSQIVMQNQLVSSMKQHIQQVEPVAKKGFVSIDDLNRRRNELINAQQGLSRLQQQAEILKQERGKVLDQINQVETEINNQIYSTNLSIEDIKAKTFQLRGNQKYIITATSNGLVTAIQTAIGKYVDASIPLMSVMPDNSKVHIDLYAPSQAIGFVKPGQTVRIFFDAFPSQKFGSKLGKIKYVSRVALDPREISAPIKSETPVYRVRVIPLEQGIQAFGSYMPLQPGMTLSGNIILERRSFLNWLLEPMHAILERNK